MASSPELTEGSLIFFSIHFFKYEAENRAHGIEVRTTTHVSLFSIIV